ncbi:MAG: MaoC family dehydratase [Steroidobacterales bacterium]
MKRHLDELNVGDRFTSGTHRIDAADIKAFAAQFDPQPFHLDEEAARRSLFGGLIASGWHTAAIAMRLMIDGGLPIAGGIIGTAADLRWLLPVRAGDELHVVCEILEIKPSTSKPDRGVVWVRGTTINQRGEPVTVAETTVIAFRRGAANAVTT